MAIQPPSDIVMDVARAADPLEYQASLQKLRNARGAVRALDKQIQNDPTAVAQGAPSNNVAPPFAQLAYSAQLQSLQKQHKTAKAFKKFEAVMLQSLIENMFTSKTPAVFGKGQAGEIWKSMMAEAIAGKVADGGGIGIAKLLEHDQNLKEKQKDIENLATITQESPERASLRRQATVNKIISENQMALIRSQMKTSDDA